MGKFSKGKIIVPIVLLIVYPELKVLFNPLVGLL